jgi:hypothetical protein
MGESVQALVDRSMLAKQEMLQAARHVRVHTLRMAPPLDLVALVDARPK